MTRESDANARNRALARDTLAALAVLVPASGAHGSVGRFSANVAGETGVASDPFLRDQGGTAAAFVNISVGPSYTIEDEFGATQFRGSFGRTEYLSRYGSTHHYGARVTSDRRIAQNATVRVAVEFDSAILGGAPRASGGDVSAPDEVLSTDTPAEPIDPFETDASFESDALFDLVDPDLELAGGRQRRTRLSTSAGLSFRPTVDDSIDLAIQASRTRYPGRVQESGYTSVGGSFGYNRALSSALSIGLRSSFEQVDYGDSDSQIYQPQLTVRGRFDSRWTYNAGVGASFVSTRAPTGKFTSRGLSANIGTCRTDPRLTACLNLDRGSSATGLGVAKRTGVELFASFSLSETETVGGRVAYSRTGDRVGLLGATTEGLSVGESYQRRLSDRLTAGFNLDGRVLYGATRTAKDLSGQLFLRISFGR